MKALRDSFRSMLTACRAAGNWHNRGRMLFFPLALAAISLFAPHKPAMGGLAEYTQLDAGVPAERYILPSRRRWTRETSDLCWVFATLSMLETNYMVRHPSSRIALSRGALQVAHDRRSI